MILGTAAYMAPEQARGRAVDKRADIWAFGVVLHEMLSGRRAFEGDDVSITLANVMKDDIAWDALPADLPSTIRRLLSRCLEKDPKKHLRDIGDARLVTWKYRSARPMVAAVTTTAGNLVLTGELGGDFLAFDARTGREVYRFNTGGPLAAAWSPTRRREDSTSRSHPEARPVFGWMRTPVRRRSSSSHCLASRPSPIRALRPSRRLRPAWGWGPTP